MKNSKIVLPLSMIAVFAVLTVFAVSTVSAANTVSFVPQHSNITGGPCNNITVALWFNTTDAIDSWQTNVSFVSACVNITNVTYVWNSSSPWSHHENYVTIGDANNTTECVAGDMHLATLTIHCVEWGCTSPLNFSGKDNETRFINCSTTTYFAATWENGTVTNEPEPTPTAVPTLQPPAIIALAGILGILAVTVIVRNKKKE